MNVQSTKCNLHTKRMREKANITPALAKIRAVGNKKVGNCLICRVGAVLQRWTVGPTVLTWGRQHLSAMDDPLGEVRRGGKPASFLPDTCSTQKATGRWFSALSEPAVLKRRGERKKGAGAQRETNHGSRREKMVSREPNPSDKQKSYSCYIQ